MSGTWADRPDHNKLYPDIAVHLELESPFTIPGGTSQSIWVDIYVPDTATAGQYQGIVTITCSGSDVHTIPVELVVRDFTLPDVPSARTMLYYNRENITNRYLGAPYRSLTQQTRTRKFGFGFAHNI